MTGIEVAAIASAVGGALSSAALAVGDGLAAVGVAATGGIATGGAAAAIGAGIIGTTGLSMYNSVKQGQANKSVYEYNAQVMEKQAAERRQQSVYEHQQKMRGLSKLLGSQTSAFGNAGVVGGTGSALDIAMDTTAQADLEAAWGDYTGRVEANNFLNQASTYRSQGKAAAKQGWLNAGMTLLGTAASVGANGAAGHMTSKAASTGNLVGGFDTNAMTAGQTMFA